MENEIKIVTIPLSNEELKNVLKEDNNEIYAIDFENSIKNLGNNHPTMKFLNYIHNCELENVLITNHHFNENFEQLMIDYISYNLKVTISILSELWNMVIFGYDNSDDRISKESKDFIYCFRNKYPEYIEEARSFFYSLLIVLTNAINPKDEASNKILEKATDNKLRYCNINIVSLYCATEFYSNLASLANDPIVSSKPYIYKEFVSNVLNGSSISYFFITENTPFRMLYIISQMKSDSEMAKNIIDDLNKSNGEK